MGANTKIAHLPTDEKSLGIAAYSSQSWEMVIKVQQSWVLARGTQSFAASHSQVSMRVGGPNSDSTRLTADWDTASRQVSSAANPVHTK